MNTKRLLKLVAFSSVVFLLCACNLLSAATPAATTAPVQPPAATQPASATLPPEPTQLTADTAVPQPTEASAQPTEPPAQPTEAGSKMPTEINFDLSGVAQSLSVESVAAVEPGADVPYWEVAPQHLLATLQGYAVSGGPLTPQIFVYPATEFYLYNDAEDRAASDLKELLQSQQAGDQMPFLPQTNSAVAMTARVQFLDFKNGQGVAFLTQLNNGLAAINNADLFYTFQGLTSDGRFYVAAILPVTHPDLPATSLVSGDLVDQLANYKEYLANTTTWLEQQPTDSFTPNLAMLDALVQSIEVK